MLYRKATLDTGVFPAEDLQALATPLQIELHATTVTVREVAGSSFALEVEALPSARETFVFGESLLGIGALGNSSDADILQRLIDVISNCSFPAVGHRETLNQGERKQLRDAMALAAHLRSAHDVFVTTDKRAFVNKGRRERLQGMFGVRILTRHEFLTELTRLRPTGT